VASGTDTRKPKRCCSRPRTMVSSSIVKRVPGRGGDAVGAPVHGVCQNA
jgi:hypothetical protein